MGILDILPRRLLIGHAFGKEYGHLRMDDTPSLPLARLCLGDVRQRRIQHFKDAAAHRKDRFGLCDFAQSAVEALDGMQEFTETLSKIPGWVEICHRRELAAQKNKRVVLSNFTAFEERRD